MGGTAGNNSAAAVAVGPVVGAMFASEGGAFDAGAALVVGHGGAASSLVVGATLEVDNGGTSSAG
jgi:hypothetical protein